MPRRSAICDCDMFSKNRSVSRVRSRSGTREGDAIVLIGIDRLGGNAAEVMTTIRELAEHGIVLRSLREGIDTSNATGRMWRANWPALRNLSWSWVVSGGQQHASASGRLDALGVTHSGVQDVQGDRGGPLIVLRDPDNIQIELTAGWHLSKQGT
jgi:hypothetical protein